MRKGDEDVHRGGGGGVGFYIPAFSANFLLPLYPVPRFPSIACSQVVGFQSFSVYIFPLLPASKSNTAAILLVMTTLLTLGAWL